MQRRSWLNGGQLRGSKTENDNHDAHVINMPPIFSKPSKRVAGVSRITETFVPIIFGVFFGVLLLMGIFLIC